jgi:hypothetical protein
LIAKVQGNPGDKALAFVHTVESRRLFIPLLRVPDMPRDLMSVLNLRAISDHHAELCIKAVLTTSSAFNETWPHGGLRSSSGPPTKRTLKLILR